MIKADHLKPNCDASSLESLRAALLRFSALPDEAWEDARPRFQEYRLDAGEYFLETGEIAQYSGFVLQGVLREFFITLKGQEFNKNFNLEGEFTGSLFDLITAEPSTASIQALTPARLLICQFADLQDLYNRHKEWERIGRLLAENLFLLKARREWEFMTLSAEQRYLLLIQKKPELEKRISQYHLASHLGISPVSLSRIRRQLGRPKLK
jgi:CRP-like cAMP-binding protein